MDANYEFSNGTAPAGSTPWLTAEFNDLGTTGSVTLTLTATNLTGTESVKEWFLNLDPTLNLSNLSFSVPTKTGSFDDPTISKGTDAFKADGDGYYDINIEFATAGDNTHRFTAGDSISYIISGIPSLTANSFYFNSTQGGGHGVYLMAAHVQNTPGGGSGSGWVAPLQNPVPEPSTIILLSIGVFGLLAFAFRQHNI
jgi:hypothetical protein